MNGLTWLLRLDFASGSVFLTDGGVTVWGGNTYAASHPVLGGFSQISEITEGFGPELAELEIVFAIPDNTALVDLQAGAKQMRAVRLWLAEFDAETGAVVGDPELRFAGKMDRLRQQFGLRQLSAVLTCVPESEVMFYSDDGNGLSPTFHKSIYPGETGHDQATGLVIPIAWGVTGGRGASGGIGAPGGGSGGGGGFGGQVDKL